MITSLSFCFEDGTLPVFQPEWIRGQVVEDTCVRNGFSSVKVNLGQLPAEQSGDYQMYEVEWRRLGASDWQSMQVATTSTSVDLPVELADGSYEVRVRATGTGGTSLFAMPLRFPLQCRSKIFNLSINFQADTDDTT